MNFDKIDKAFIILVMIGSLIGSFAADDGTESMLFICLACVGYIGDTLFDKLRDIEKKIDEKNK